MQRQEIQHQDGRGLRLTEEETRLIVGSLGFVQATLDEMSRTKEIQECIARLQTVWMLLGDCVPGAYNVSDQQLRE